MKSYLKIKILSLAAEALLIRREERRALKSSRRYRAGHPSEFENGETCYRMREFIGLREHRLNDVRREARAALLAYGFLRGRRYNAMEAKPRERPAWKRVEALVTKYGEGDIRDRMQRFSEWKAAAEA